MIPKLKPQSLTLPELGTSWWLPSALLRSSSSHKWDVGPAGAVAPRNLLEMKILGSHPELLSQKPWGWDPAGFNKLCRWFWCTVRTTAVKCEPWQGGKGREEGLASFLWVSILFPYREILKWEKENPLLLRAEDIRKHLSFSLSIPKCFPSPLGSTSCSLSGWVLLAPVFWVPAVHFCVLSFRWQ